MKYSNSFNYPSSIATFFIAGIVSLASATALQEIDLASSTAWTINGAVKTVPGGGWNAQGISKTIDSVVYLRSVTVPDAGADKVYKIVFGAVNHGCKVYINDQLLQSHVGPMMPVEVDMTGKVTPGSTVSLKVTAYSWDHYANLTGGRGNIPKGFNSSYFSEGITKYVKLVVYPQVYIKDIFVRPSVKTRQLNYDLWIHNSGATSRSISLTGNLTSWNKDAWAYPTIDPKDVSLPAGAVTKVTIGPMSWDLPPASYWWPNIPFRETYAAKLHYLRVSMMEGTTVLDTLKQRFGFVEHAEGPYYYTVNGVRIGTQPSDGTNEDLLGYYDGYSTSPAFLPPTATTKGCPETWRRYLRLGVNTNRTHQSTPTEYMMQAADEVGFLLIPETGLRGSSGQPIWGPDMPACERELAQVCRNHPSVCRYSLSNEFSIVYGGLGQIPAEEKILIDTLVGTDPTRPLVNEMDYVDPPSGISYGSDGKSHTQLNAHYRYYRGWPTTKTTIQGMGEYDYSNPSWGGPFYCGYGDLLREADEGLDMRRRDIVTYAVWTITLYWPNFLEGNPIGRGLHSGNRVDNVGGWGSDTVKFIQRALDPYIVLDKAIHDANICYTPNWPTNSIPTLTAGQSVSRELIVFNGGFFGNHLSVLWEARRGSPTGAVAASGIVDPITVEPGFFKSATLTFTVPSATATTDTAPVTGNGKIMYKEDRVYYTVGGQKLYMILKSVLFDGDPPTSTVRSLLSNAPASPARTFKTVGGRFLRAAGQNGHALIDIFDFKGSRVSSMRGASQSGATALAQPVRSGVYIAIVKTERGGLIRDQVVVR